MKELIEKAGERLNEFRNGDRIIVGGRLSLDSSVYRMSKRDEPYVSYGYDTDFSISLLKLVLIVLGIVLSSVLIAVFIKNKINKILKSFKIRQSR
ncbi:MAG: hypothetical protein J5933_00805 [Clostridia bacterium]|nr:hypothetical protein [Clostridia bacterium]